MRPLLAPVIVLFALASTGCPEPEPIPCGDPEGFDRSTCSPTELAGVDRAGLWHGVSAGTEGNTFISIVSYPDPASPQVQGYPGRIDVDGGFFLATDYDDQGAAYRIAYAGCHSTGPNHLTGEVEVCVNGTSRLRGAFEMTRVQRQTGETEASHLVLRGEARVTQGTPKAVWANGGYAYVAAGFGGLSIYNVSNPAAPALAAQMSFQDNYISDVLVKDNVLYVASESVTASGISESGVLYYDLSTSPSNPRYLNVQPAARTSVRSLGLDDTGNRLFANSSDTGQVLVLDVTNAVSPLYLGAFNPGNPGGLSGLYPHASAGIGNTLYSTYGALGVVLGDLTQASAPTQIGGALAPDSAASHGLAAGVFGASSYVFETGYGWNGHLRAIDVTNAGAPVVATNHVMRPSVTAGPVDLVGNKLYVAYHQDGVRIFDVTNPAAPTLYGYFNTWADTQTGRGKVFAEGTVAVRKARDGSAMVYALDNQRGLLVLEDVP